MLQPSRSAAIVAVCSQRRPVVDPHRLAREALGRRLTLAGYFASPVTVEAAEPEGADTVFLRVRTQAGSLDEVPVSVSVLEAGLLDAASVGPAVAAPHDLFLLVESSRIRLAYAHDPYFAVTLSGVEALPHQLEAVYEQMVPQSQLRFLLAHDPGAGKTIMAGLLIKELKLRGVLDRVLILCPAPLTIQWYDEMLSKFEERFTPVDANFVRSRTGNVWDEESQVISSLDYAKQDHVLPDLVRAAPWDLIVIDEAHKMSARTYGTEVKKTRRYVLGEFLSQRTDRLLLCTATPHQGDADQFAHFLRLLDSDQFVDLHVDRQVLQEPDNPWVSRRVKEDMRDFNGRRLFPRRTAVTPPLTLSRAEKDLYDEVTEYINTFLPRQSGRRRGSVALARTVLQRRLASSLGAIEATLSSRRQRFQKVLDEVGELTPAQQERLLRELRLLDHDEEIQDDDASEDELLDFVSAVTVANRIEDIRLEVDQLAKLLAQLERIPRVEEAKLKLLHRSLDGAEFAELKDGRGRLLIFTEYRATQDYLVDHLKKWGYKVCTIHGGMDAARRREAQMEFQRSAQICVATEAAGEGINLQFCHLMINYDLPWNPNRLEQRMGRVHRIGQEFDVTVFNFVASNTVEGTILRRLLEKLEEIRGALGSDRVFDVIGTLLELNDVNLEEMLREAAYNPGRLAEYESQIGAISMTELERYEKTTGIALATRQVNLEAVRPKDWRSAERRLMPEYVEGFFREAADRVRLRVEPRADGLWRVDHVPERLRNSNLPAVRRYRRPERSYRKLTFNKVHLTESRHLDAELCSPGHPLFAAMVDVLDEELSPVRQGCSVFADPGATDPYRLYFFELRVVGELGPDSPGGPPRPQDVHAELAVVLEDASGNFEVAAPDILHDLTPAREEAGAGAPVPDDIRRAERWLRINRASELVTEQRTRRQKEIGIRRDYLERSFYELEKQRRARWADLASKVAGGDESYRLARDEAMRQLEEVGRRREAKLAELRHLEVLRPGPATFLGSASVIAVDEQEVARVARQDRSAEARAIEVVEGYERSEGWEPFRVFELRDGSGFDIRSTRLDADGQLKVRRIEVKGHLGDDSTSLLTPNEWTQARRHGAGYWLYIVTGCDSPAPRLYRVQDPAARLGRRAQELNVVKGYILPAAAIERTAEVIES